MVSQGNMATGARRQALHITLDVLQLAMHPTPAAQVVLATNELFEQILLELDMRTLLLAQRVDYRWYALINQSKSLQKKLFFIPATRQDLKKLNLLEMSNEHDLNINAIKVHKCPLRKGEPDILVLNPLLMTQQTLQHEGIIHPQEASLRRSPPSEAEYQRRWWPKESSLKNKPKSQQFESINKSKMHPSWTKMLLVQPQPSFAATCLVTLHAAICYSRFDIDLRAPLQKIVDTAVRRVKREVPWRDPVVVFGAHGEQNVELSMFGFPVSDEDLERLGMKVPVLKKLE